MTTSAFGASPQITPTHTAPQAGVVPTIRIREHVKAKTIAGPLDGMRPESVYIRRFWVAAIGPGAVADLLRVTRAAKLKTTLRKPMYLHVLVQTGLAAYNGETVTVMNPVPLIPPHLLRRLPPKLRREHDTWMRLRRELS